MRAGSSLLVDIMHCGSVVRHQLNSAAVQERKEGLESLDNRQQFQVIDVEHGFLWRPEGVNGATPAVRPPAGRTGVRCNLNGETEWTKGPANREMGCVHPPLELSGELRGDTKSFPLTVHHGVEKGEKPRLERPEFEASVRERRRRRRHQAEEVLGVVGCHPSTGKKFPDGSSNLVYSFWGKKDSTLYSVQTDPYVLNCFGGNELRLLFVDSETEIGEKIQDEFCVFQGLPSRGGDYEPIVQVA
uniref:Uncharacterized protein n=1 Tax=Pogona vitticeps TaxID=103695 RepID=A0ABM5F2U3_9SAUR